MNPAIAAVSAVAGYLVGSVSFARLVGRWVAPGDDLSATPLNLPGDATIDYGGVSATSIAVRSGPRWGVATGLLDMAKAFVPTLAARLVWPGESYYVVVAVAVIVGHNYPVFHRFKGGRGQTTLYGSLLAIDWLAVPVTTVIGVAVGLALREMLIAYTLGMWLLVPWFVLFGTGAEVVYAVAANLLYLVATLPEMRRYWAKRRAGEVRQVRSWRELRSAHPAMRGRRNGEEGR